MALFKISKGSVAALDKQTRVDGYAWFTPEDGKFYIDAPVGENETIERVQLNSTYAVSATLTYANSTFTLGTPDKAYADIVKAKTAGNYVFFKLTFDSLVIMLPLSKTSSTSITFEGDFIYDSTMIHGNIVMNSTGTNSFTCNTVLGGTYKGDFSAGNKKITNLADPVNSADAVNLNYLGTNYKKVQTAVASPSSSSSDISFIDTISQNTQGVISATKKAVREASTSQSGVVSTGAQSFAGNKTFTGTLTASGATTLNNTLSVSGATTLSSSLEVGGTSNLKNDVTVATGKNVTLTNGWVISSKAPEAKTHLVNKEYADQLLSVNDAMIFKGILGTEDGMISTGLPTPHEAGWTYKVGTAGSYAGQWCEIGDTIYCIKDSETASNNDWVVIQVNIDGAVTGPASSTDNAIARFDSTSGKIIQNSSAILDDTGKLTAPYIETGSADANYFQSKKFRGEGDASTYYHAIDFGYANHDMVDFYEYGGTWNFYQNKNKAKGGTLVASIQPDGFHGNLIANDQIKLTSSDKKGFINYGLPSTAYNNSKTMGGKSGLNISQGADATSGMQFNGDYIVMWSPADDYTLRYFDQDTQEDGTEKEIWNITAAGAFSGSAAKLTTARTLTIGNKGYSFDGSADVSWTLADIGAAASSHTHNYAGSSSAGGAATSALTCTGNAATATKLATARTINGTSFNGTGNIVTSYWGAARTITIGNTSKSVNGASNVSWTLSEIGASMAQRYTVSASAGASTVAFGTTYGDTTYLTVYQNGILLTPGTNYTVNSDKAGITLVDYTTQDGDIFTFINSENTSSSVMNEIVRGRTIATAGASTIAIPISISSTTGLGVYENGVLLEEGDQYTATTTAITLNGYTANAGDVYTFVTNSALVGNNVIPDASKITLNSDSFTATTVKGALEEIDGKYLPLTGGTVSGTLKASSIYLNNSNTSTTFNYFITDNGSGYGMARVGKSNLLTAYTSTTTITTSGSKSLRNIMFKTAAPTSSEGVNGDICIVYTA